MSTQKSTLPKAVHDMKRVVEKTCGKSMEAGVVERLVDFEYEYVMELLQDARHISQYLGKKDIDVEDVKLAKEMSDKSTANAPRPSKPVLTALAQKINEIPLPQIKQTFGLRIPGDRFCMTSCNYQTMDVVEHEESPTMNGGP
ncbi:transcription initiation factor TFIID subunit 9-like isoform X2 [Paramacrobiotus metropolitanus]|nr:transcription initiation factor TFIID subunit 9-like isoform X2 [Paramacrobiotus metropolitanus]